MGSVFLFFKRADRTPNESAQKARAVAQVDSAPHLKDGEEVHQSVGLRTLEASYSTSTSSVEAGAFAFDFFSARSLAGLVLTVTSKLT